MVGKTANKTISAIYFNLLLLDKSKAKQSVNWKKIMAVTVLNPPPPPTPRGPLKFIDIIPNHNKNVYIIFSFIRTKPHTLKTSLVNAFLLKFHFGNLRQPPLLNSKWLTVITRQEASWPDFYYWLLVLLMTWLPASRGSLKRHDRHWSSQDFLSQIQLLPLLEETTDTADLSLRSQPLCQEPAARPDA